MRENHPVLFPIWVFTGVLNLGHHGIGWEREVNVLLNKGRNNENNFDKNVLAFRSKYWKCFIKTFIVYK